MRHIFVTMRHDPPELVGVYDTLEAAERAMAAEKQDDSRFSGWIIEQTFGTIDKRSYFVGTH